MCWDTRNLFIHGVAGSSANGDDSYIVVFTPVVVSLQKITVVGAAYHVTHAILWGCFRLERLDLG